MSPVGHIRGNVSPRPAEFGNVATGRRARQNARTLLRAAITATLLIVSPALLPSAEPVASTPAAADDTFPKGAVLRLGTDRFRQEGEVSQLAYSPDGTKIASISRQSILLRDSRSGKLLRRLRPRSDDAFARHISALAFSPDGEEIAGADHGHVYLWEVDTGLELLSFPVVSDFGFIDDVEIRYSPNGERLAVGGGMSVLLFDTASGKQTTELKIDGHQAAFYGICWTPDGKHLAAGTLQPAVVLWDTESGELVRRFQIDNDDALAFSRSPVISADGKTLMAGSGGIIHFWRFATGNYVKKIKLDADFINTIVPTLDGKNLIVGSQDGAIRIVDAESGKLLKKIDGRLWIGRSLAVSPDFKSVALGAVYPTIRQWDISTGEEKFPEWTATGHDAEVHCVAWSPDGRLIASGGANWQINLWDAETGKLRRRLPAEGSANRIAFTSSGRHLLTSWMNAGVIRVWDVAAGNVARTIDSGKKKVRAFAMTPDDMQLVAVVSDSPYEWHSPVGDEAFQVWNFETGEKLREFTFKTASTQSLALTGDGKTLVTGSANGMLHVLDTVSGNEIALLPGHQHSVESLAFARDGTLLASGSMDQTIRIWDAQKWRTLRILKGHERAVTSVAFSPDGRVLASGSGKSSYPLPSKNPHRIRLWDVDSGKQIGAFSGHDTNTSAIAFAPDGQRIVSGHDNTTLMVWDVSQMGNP